MKSSRGRAAVRQGGLVLAVLGLLASTGMSRTQRGAEPATSSPPNLAALRTALAQVKAAGAPGVFAGVRYGAGNAVTTRNVTVGTGDLRTNKPVDGAGRFRVGSVTKTFDAVLVLKLVAAHRVELDQPASRYLPAGTLPANWHITVRELLSHTSGLYDYTNSLLVGDTITNYKSIRYRIYDPASLVAMSVKHGLDFTPGKKYEYSNTNFVVLGLLLQHVTGQSYVSLLDDEIIRPLRLTATSFVVPTTTIAGAHATGYLTPDNRGQPLFDATDQTASWIWSAGGLISDSADLDTFLRALMTGRLLPAAQLAEMERTRPADTTGTSFYGLGIREYTLPCGVDVFGHDGIIEGYETYAYTSKDGSRQVTVSADASNNNDVYDALRGALNPVFCGTRGTVVQRRIASRSAELEASAEPDI